MALPSGYKQLAHITATGTQYINTGFKPNQDTTVEFSVVNGGALQYYFGAWNTAYNNGAFAYCNDGSNVYIGYDGQGGGTGSVITGDHVIKLAKNIAYLDGAVFSSYTYTAFQVNYPLFLFGQNRAGTFFTSANNGGISCAYCKIWDNGTLVRDFVPASRTSDGAIGMYDLVNDVFYTNAGSGTFGATYLPVGKSRMLLSAGTGYDVVGGKVLVDGTAYNISKGRVLVDGTGYDIVFSMALADVPVGGSVFLNVDGVAKEFIVVHRGNPDESIYDDSCDGVWVMMKDVWANQKMNSHNYSTSYVHTALNNDFISQLDPGVQDIVKSVIIPYHSGSYERTISGETYEYPGSLYTGANGLSTKAFLLGARETNFNGTGYSGQVPEDGACLDYFIGATNEDRIVATQSGDTSSNWWTRSPTVNSPYYFFAYVGTTGNSFSTVDSSNYWMRPAMILPHDLTVDASYNIVA